jgi:hypothetical protein
MLVKEFWSENPRSIRNDLIDPPKAADIVRRSAEQTNSETII